MAERRRIAGLVLALASFATLATSCGSGSKGNEPTSAAEVGSVADGGSTSDRSPATTPSNTPGRNAPGSVAATASTPAGTEPPQSAVQSQVVVTPKEALSIPAPLPNDYKITPAGTSIVLQATVPSVRVFSDATGANVATTIANPLPSGTPLTFLVDGQTNTRYKVLLPIKPNGSTGWVEPADVGIKRAHQYKIVVSLGAHRILVTNGPSVVLDEKIAVGKSATPTPDGRYFIKELLQPPNPNGPYGPYAYGLSGYSPVEQNFRGGDDTIGIHGTDEPQFLGTDVSHGCIRMSNTGITTLAKILPLGTPVVIQA